MSIPCADIAHATFENVLHSLTMEQALVEQSRAARNPPCSKLKLLGENIVLGRQLKAQLVEENESCTLE